ncbi:hypothetical protein NPIL_397941 [Nephila pilipes]|uniref:Uncharacterized protein n=1 Tax=Nephila pilipes TaxID=299642 RepID=A0A8X6N6S0_NEPPI|nr:hypothetical protein NPIL_397941 [Nephila pilipes]
MDQSDTISAFSLLIKAGSATSRVILCLALLHTISYIKDEHTFAKAAFFYHRKDADTFFKFLQDFRHRLLALQPSEVLPLNMSYQDLLTQHLKQ